MNNDAILAKALNEIARLELLNFKKDAVIEELQHELRMRDQLKEGEKNATSINTKHKQANSQSKPGRIKKQ